MADEPELASREARGTPEDVVARLRMWLGQPFVDWVLNRPGDQLADAQREVAHILEARVAAHLVEHPDWPASNALAPLTGWNEPAGTTYLNALQFLAGGAPVDPLAPTGDDLLDALREVACHAYGELLLSGDEFRFLMSPYSSPAGKRVVDLVSDDPTFAFSDEREHTGRTVYTLRSTGSGGGLQATGVASSLLVAAWEVAQLDHEVPSFEQVLQKLEPLLAQARAAFTGKPATVTGLASLSGVVLPENTSLDLGWGRLVNAAPHHHPDFIGRSSAQRRTTRRLEDGTEVAVSDAGEVLLECEVPYEVHIGEFDLSDGGWPSLKSTHTLNERIMQVRLAHLLSSTEPEPPVLLPVWQRFIEPVTQSFSVGLNDPSLYAQRTPSRLTKEQVTSWAGWIRCLHDVPLRKLGVAPARLIRAAAERRDPYDSLVDSVIAWEAMFAADTEAVLRVSAAMARLLHTAGPDRNKAKTQIAHLYRLRSKIVHGNDVDPEEAHSASRDAVRLTIETMRCLLQHRPDLVSMTSSERSTTLLLE